MLRGKGKCFRGISSTADALVDLYWPSPTYGRDSVLLCRRCDTLCTSGFVDDVCAFRHRPNGQEQAMKKACTQTDSPEPSLTCTISNGCFITRHS